MAKPQVFANYPKLMRLPYGPYMAVVDRVIDGDTIVLIVDIGFDEYACAVVRLARINAPEMSEAAGLEARDFVLSLLPYGSPVQVVATAKDPYGRYVGEVTLQDARNLSDAIVDAGHAELHSY